MSSKSFFTAFSVAFGMLFFSTLTQLSAQDGVNLALGKATQQSSRSGANGAGSSDRAVDGNTAGTWNDQSCTMTKQSPNPWWQVDLGHVYDIRQITIWNRAEQSVRARLNGFYIMASENPITANSMSKNLYIDGPQSDGNKASLTFRKDAKARYIRIFIPGTEKRLSLVEVQVIGSGKPSNWTIVGLEGGDFRLNYETTVIYGADGKYHSKKLEAGAHKCNNATFGDPAPGVVKRCYVSLVEEQEIDSGGPSNSITVAEEAGYFRLSSETTVIYGADGVYNSKKLEEGAQKCDDDTFGNPFTDKKKCYDSLVEEQEIGSGEPSNFLAEEGRDFSLSSETTVIYGAYGKYYSKKLEAGKHKCYNATFGGDPVLRKTEKKCYVKKDDNNAVIGGQETFLPNSEVNWEEIARQDQSFSLDYNKFVRYGAKGKYVYREMDGTQQCNDATFGDPAPGVAKECWTCYGNPFFNWEEIASEDQSFFLDYNKFVRYGANGKFAYQVMDGTQQCNNATFGDPAPRVAKKCWTSYENPFMWNLITGEDRSFTLLAKSKFLVRYGANGKYVYRVMNGTQQCNNATFGDPAPGVIKRCEVYGDVSTKGFYMILTSDSQFPRARDEHGNEGSNLVSKSMKNNKNHVSSMNTLIDNFSPVSGVIMNGDFTERGAKLQRDKMHDLYGDGSLRAPFYPGLGNHDYENNVGDCGSDKEDCAEDMIRYIEKFLKKKKKARNNNINLSFDWDFKNKTGSLAYSWDIDNIHFVQLHNSADYYVTANEYTITPSITWLENDLKSARDQGKRIIINQHKPGKLYEIDNLIKDYKVSAAFVGHLHDKVGYDGEVGGAPRFFCGSSITHRYLFVHFKGNEMEVFEVNSNPDDKDYGLSEGKTYPFRK